MKKMQNATHVEGWVYESSLEVKTSGPQSKNPGVQFISGNLGVATDDEMTNVVQVHFTYVTENTAKGQPNATYIVLNGIINGKIGTVMRDGKENAGKVRIDSAIGLNEFYANDGQLVSQRRNEGGFVHQTQELGDPKTRATFNTDMLITNVIRVEADEERELPEKVTVKGCVFNFRNDILPVEFTVLNERAMDYFENLGATPKTPVFTRVQGIQVSQTVVRQIEEEGAWGEVSVREVRSSNRDFVINWAQAEPYVWDDESTITAAELSEKMAKRELDLAEIKKRREEWQANQGNALAQGATTAPKKDTSYEF